MGTSAVEGEASQIRVDGRSRQVKPVLTPEQLARRRRGEWIGVPKFVPTGDLRLHLSAPAHGYSSGTWKDGARRQLEGQFDSILLGCHSKAVEIRQRRKEDARAREAERLLSEQRYRRAQRRDANARSIRELESQAGAWFRARALTAYLRALRRALGNERVSGRLRGKKVDLVAWAERYIDQLNPLSRTRHDPDLVQNRSDYQCDDAQDMEGCLARLVGVHWQVPGSWVPPPRREGSRCVSFGPGDRDE